MVGRDYSTVSPMCDHDAVLRNSIFRALGTRRLTSLSPSLPRLVSLHPLSGTSAQGAWRTSHQPLRPWRRRPVMASCNPRSTRYAFGEFVLWSSLIFLIGWNLHHLELGHVRYFTLHCHHQPAPVVHSRRWCDTTNPGPRSGRGEGLQGHQRHEGDPQLRPPRC